MENAERYANFHIPLSNEEITLEDAWRLLRLSGDKETDLPWAVRIFENPYLPLFPGSTDLKTHDFIHLLLGRGLAPKDEAFVLGFTMGSTHKMSNWKERAYIFVARHLYPRDYRFTFEDVRVFRSAVRAGREAKCASLSEVKYDKFLHVPLGEIRRRLHLSREFLLESFRKEKQAYPRSFESQRLLS